MHRGPANYPAITAADIVEVLPEAVILELPDDWEVQLPRGTRSVWNAFYEWLKNEHGLSEGERGLHTRTYIGQRVAKRCKEIDAALIRKQHRGISKDELEHALAWRDLGSGPFTQIGTLRPIKIKGNVVIVVPDDGERVFDAMGKIEARVRKVVNRRIERNASSTNFSMFLLSLKDHDSPIGDLAADAATDPSFPKTADHYVEICRYIKSSNIWGSLGGWGGRALQDAWWLYLKKNPQRAKPLIPCSFCGSVLPPDDLSVPVDSDDDESLPNVIDSDDGESLPNFVCATCRERQHAVFGDCDYMPYKEWRPTFVRPYDPKREKMRQEHGWRDDLDVLEAYEARHNGHNTVGYVYFIQAGGGPIKIGYASNDVEARRSSLQTGNHETLTIIATTPGGQDVERALHTLFQADRLNGEWFKPSPLLLAYISTISKKPDN